MAAFAGSNNIAIISPDLIHAAGHGDPQYEKLISVIQQGFPRTHNLTAPKVREYWEERHHLSTDNGLVLLDRKIVIPKTQRRKFLHCTSRSNRHESMCQWIGILAWNGCSIRANCMVCSNITPWEPIILTQSPDWPFQQIVMDLFHTGDHTYLACADRLIGWLILYCLKPGHVTTTKLMSIYKQLFQTYGAPEELGTDGSPPFTSSVF